MNPLTEAIDSVRKTIQKQLAEQKRVETIREARAKAGKEHYAKVHKMLLECLEQLGVDAKVECILDIIAVTHQGRVHRINASYHVFESSHGERYDSLGISFYNENRHRAFESINEGLKEFLLLAFRKEIEQVCHEQETIQGSGLPS